MNAVREDSFFLEVAVDELPSQGARFHLNANGDAQRSIAERLEVPAVKRLSGEFHLTPTRDGVRLVGMLDATLVRQCVMSLEPLEEVVAETFEIEFSRGADDADGDPA
ncbi:MAG TPA: hypothetical protein VNH64_10800, partial [Parvularculaceae bacterium]|nr:hypothetical protein [Parvularculaceae bacterium]